MTAFRIIAEGRQYFCDASTDVLALQAFRANLPALDLDSFAPLRPTKPAAGQTNCLTAPPAKPKPARRGKR